MTFFDLFRSFYESWRFNPNRKHDERLGQRLYNDLRPQNIYCKGEHGVENYKALIADKLWNMSDHEFIEFLERFFS